MRVAVIADDLTGATDSGVQFTRAGYRVAVAFQGASVPPAEAADAGVVDTDSRSLSPVLARERVLEAGENFRGAGIFFKKVDSTLRGPFSMEIAAALQASGREKVIVAPAFPESGRTTVDGVQMLYGVPVHETELANDPRTPVREGHIPSLLDGGGLEPLRVLGVEDLDEPSLIRAALDDCRCLVADAETGDHLGALVRAVPDPSKVLWVGSAGLALALGESYPGPGFEPEALGEPAGRVVVVVGSTSEVACEQRRQLSGESGTTGVTLNLPPDAGTVKKALQDARAALGGGHTVVLFPGENAASGVNRLAERIVEGLAEVVRGLSEEGFFDALVLTGGDTAVNVARAVGAEGMMLEDEIEPGVPAGTLIGPYPYRVVTKAGGFGKPDTLCKAARYLRGETERTRHP